MTGIASSRTTLDRISEGVWQLDPARSCVAFRARHFWGLVTVEGRFDSYGGLLDLRADPAVQLTIHGATLDTGNRKRDEHLRSADFFDIERYPQMRFVSDSATLVGDTLKVRGHLHARGSRIPLELKAHIRETGDELEIEAATTAPHRELGMTWSPLGMLRARSHLQVSGRLVRAGADAHDRH